MIPARYAPIAFGLLLSGMMSFLVSGVATIFTLGFGVEFFGQWMLAWLPSWAVAFPAILIVAPLARRIVTAITTKE